MATIDVKLKPFTVPNFALMDVVENDETGGSFPLSALDPHTLEAMCEEFTRSVFKKAGKRPPDKVYAAPRCPKCDGAVA